MVPSHNLQDVPLSAGAVLTTTVLNAVGRQFPSSQEKRGDDKLNQARDLVTEVRTFVTEDDLTVIEDKITQ